MGRIDRSKANIKKKGWRFAPFRVQAKHAVKLATAGYADGRDLLAFERGGERRVVTLTDATYHHAIQGELAGHPYLVSF